MHKPRIKMAEDLGFFFVFYCVPTGGGRRGKWMLKKRKKKKKKFPLSFVTGRDLGAASYLKT